MSPQDIKEILVKQAGEERRRRQLEEVRRMSAEESKNLLDAFSFLWDKNKELELLSGVGIYLRK